MSYKKQIVAVVGARRDGKKIGHFIHFFQLRWGITISGEYLGGFFTMHFKSVIKQGLLSAWIYASMPFQVDHSAQIGAESWPK